MGLCDHRSTQMDVINLVSKVPYLPDAPITEPGEKYQPAAEFYANGYVDPLKRYRLFTKFFRPRVHEYIQQMHREVLSSQSLLSLFRGRRVHHYR